MVSWASFLNLLSNEYVLAGIIFASATVIATIIIFMFERVFLKLTKRTKTELDDEIIRTVKRPLYYSILLFGLSLSLSKIGVVSPFYAYISKIITTLLAVLWIFVVIKILSIFIEWLTGRVEKRIALTLVPLLRNVLKICIYFVGFMLLLVIWNVDITPFLASAGIVGIALGFAAKDSLANFFGGIMIFLDKPYKIGDVIQLDTGEIGEVLKIGLRSTLIRTKDNVQISIPNAITAGSKIINLSMPVRRIRLRVPVGVAYESDIKKVKRVLLEVVKKNKNVLEEPAPVVRFLEFGESSLNLEVRCWIQDPWQLRAVRDEINTEIYERFAKEKIEIPFPQRVVHIQD